MESNANFGVPSGNVQVILQPKLKYRFRVLTNLPDVNQILTKQTYSIDRPKIVMDYNDGFSVTKRYLPIVWILRDDLSNLVMNTIEAQMMNGNSFIDSLDEGAETSERWEIRQALVEKIDYNEFSYSSNDPCLIALTLKFKSAAKVY